MFTSKRSEEASLVLCGEDFKEAISQDEIQHLDKRDRYSRQEGKKSNQAPVERLEERLWSCGGGDGVPVIVQIVS